MPNIIINGGTINQTVGSGNTGSRSIILRTKDTYVLENIQVNVSASATAGTFANSVPSGTENSYIENTSNDTIIPENGYLYMSGGWYEKQKISLGHLIPDIAGSEHDAGVAHIRTGFKAYDEDGGLLIGTMNDVTPLFDGGDVTTTASLSYTPPSGEIQAQGTFLPIGTGNVGANYGVSVYDTQNPPTGSDGVNFVTIDAVLGSVTNGSAQASSTANRSAVLYNGNWTGYLEKSDNTEALAAPQSNATDSSTVTTINLTSLITDNFPRYYIPIVSPVLDGGDVTKTGQTDNISCVVSGVTLTTTGGVVTQADNGYGIHSYTPTDQNPDPSSGTDGTSYLAIKTTGSGGTATVSGTIGVNFNRSDVKSNGVYKGLVNISDDATLLSGSNGTLTANVSSTQSATITGGSYYYIDIVTPTASGGALPNGSITIDATGSTTTGVTPNVGIYALNSSGTILSTDCGNDFGVTTTAPTTSQENWVALDPQALVDAVDISASITVQPSAVTLNCSPGITAGMQNATSHTPAQRTYSGISTVTIPVNEGSNRYVKVTHPTATATCAVSNPSVTTTTTASMAGGTGHPVDVPNSATPTTTAPSDLSTYTAGYIVISPGTSTSSTGTATADATASTTKGLVRDETVNANQDSQTITTQINNTDGAKAYIKIWNMGYNVDSDNTIYYGQLGS